MSETMILSAAAGFALVILSLAFLITVARIVLGPTLPDRVVGLDMLVSIAIGFIAVIAMKTGYTLYLDIAIALGLVGFLASVAFARFVLIHPIGAAAGPPEPTPEQSRKKAQKTKRRGR